MGRLSGLPLDLWSTDSVYHSAGRGGVKRGGRRGGVEEEKQGEGTERSYRPFAYRAAQTDENHFWKRINQLLHC